MLRNSTEGWGLISRLFHWVMFILILFMLGLGIYLDEFLERGPEKFKLMQLHKSLGAVALLLVVLRVFWLALGGSRPQEPAESKPWEKTVAKIVYGLLYLLLFLIPLSGWMMVSASPRQDTSGVPYTVFNLFEMPDPFVPGNKALASFFSSSHEIMTKMLLFLFVIHVIAALKHHYVNKNNVLTRMTKGQ